MKQIIDEKKCCGCGVCAAACPAGAIKMVKSGDGFFIPEINESNCTDCHICQKVCSQNSADPAPVSKLPSPVPFSFIHNDKIILQKASSGGLGWALAQAIFDRGWSAVGVKYDLQKNIACHFKADTIEAFVDSMNSKYLQSFTSDAFSDLFDGKKYIVFGTPCQIDSLRRMIQLRHKEQNFVLVDFFCHGVPSYHVWQRYLQHYAKDTTLTTAKWRDKSCGWHSFTMRLETEKKSYVNTLQKHDFFLNSFLGNIALNQPCYSCKFRRTDSSADIRIGDFWGEKYQRNNTGVSAALALTDTGKTILESLDKYGKLTGESLPDILFEQISGQHNPPATRKGFIEGLKSGKSLFFLYCLYNRKMLIKNLIPLSLKQFLKKILRKLKGKQ